MNKKKKDRYKSVDGKSIIEVRVKTAQQLFDARDPSPFIERDLDDDFAEYIITSAQEFSSSTPLKVLIYVGEKSPTELSRDSILQAIREYFLYQQDLKRKQLSKIFKTGQLFLIIGSIFLVLCLALAQLATKIPNENISHVVKEGFTIFGWVSMWKPLELILFDWWPMFDRIRLFGRLLQAEYEVIFEVQKIK